MASKVDFILNLDGSQARKVLLDLHAKGNNLFSKNGYKLQLDAKGFNRSLDQATYRVLSFGAATAVLGGVGLAMRRLASDAITVETAISKIQSILNLTSSDLKGFTNSLFDLANKAGVGFSDAATAAEEFSRQGLSLEKTLKATEAALSLARVSGGNLAKTVQDLVAITSAFGSEALVYADVADTLGALDAAFSTTTTGLAEGLARVASIANDVGVSFEEMASLIAATKQVTGRSEAVIGNAFKSIFTNIGTEKVQEELRAIGVETKNLDGTFIDSEQVLKNLAKAYEGLTDAQQANITFKVAGKYNKNILQGAIFAEQSGTTDKALAVAGDSSGSIAKRLQTLNDTTATSIQRLQNSITQLGAGGIGGIFTGLTKEITSALGDAVGVIAGIFEKENPIGNALSAGIVSVLSGPVLLLGSALIIKIIKKIVGDLYRASRSVFDSKKGFESQLTVLKQIGLELKNQNATLTQRANAASKAPVKKAATGGRMTGAKPYDPFETNPTTQYPTSSISPAYLKNRQADRKAQVAAQKSQAAAAKLARSQAYADAPGTTSMFGIAKKERALANSYGSTDGAVYNTRVAAARDARAQKLKGIGFGTGFAAPLLGSAAGSLIGGSGGRVAESVGQGVGAAALLASFGKIPGVIGLVLGSLQIFKTVTEETFGNFEQLNKELSDGIALKQKESEAGDSFVQAQLAFNDALASGEAILIDKARKELATAAGALTGDFSALLGETDPKRLTQLNEGLKTTSEKLQSASLAFISANTAVANSYEDTTDKFLSLMGRNKSISRSEAKPLVDSIVGSLDPSQFRGKLGELQGRLAGKGDDGSVGDFVQSLISGSDELTSSFNRIADKFEGGAQALSLFIFEALGAKDAVLGLQKSQSALTQSSATLADNFRRAVSRVTSEGVEANKSRFGTLRSKLNQADILSGSGGTETQQLQTAFTKGLAEIAINAGENKSEKALSFKGGITDSLLKGAQGSGNIEKITEFIKILNSPEYDVSNTLKDLEDLKLNTGTIDAAKKSFNELGDSLEAARKEAQRSVIALKSETEAKLKVARKNESLNRFGDVNEDQSGLLSDMIGGNQALRDFKKREIETRKKMALDSSVKPARLTENEADRIIKANKSAKDAGRKSQIADDELRAANVAKYQAVAVKQAAPLIGDFINGVLNKPGSNNRRDPSVIESDSKAAKAINDFILQANFVGATKEAGKLSVGSSEVAAKIQEEVARYNEAKPGGNLAADEQIADNTTEMVRLLGILAEAKKADSTLDKITPGASNLSTIGKTFGGAAKIEDINKSLSVDNQKLKVIQDAINKSVFDRTNLETGLTNATRGDSSWSTYLLGQGSSNLQEQKIEESDFGESLDARTGIGTTDKILGASLNKFEAEVMRKGFEENSSASDRVKFFKANLGEERYNQVVQGLDGTLPKMNANFDVSQLQREKQEVEKRINDRESEKKKLEQDQKTLEASQNFKVGAETLNAGIATLAQGIVQNVEASIGVNIAGGDFATDEDTQTNLSAFVKQEFIKYYKEATGKEPVLAPVK